MRAEEGMPNGRTDRLPWFAGAVAGALAAVGVPLAALSLGTPGEWGEAGPVVVCLAGVTGGIVLSALCLRRALGVTRRDAQSTDGR